MFSQTVNAFLEYLQAVKNASKHTLRNYAIDLKTLQEFIQETSPKKQMPRFWPSARYLHLKPFGEEAREVFPNTHVAKDLKVIQFPRH